ncbi:PAS domain S-box protein, partial [Candidatus Omnitrophota bacterium]
ISLLRDKDEQPVGIFGVARDITNRRWAEERLRESEQNFRNSLDNSPLGIRIVSADGKLLYVNQAILDIYGYSSIEELKTTPVKQRYTPESFTEHQERKKRKRRKPVPSSYEISIVRKDGSVRHLVVFRKEVIWGGKPQFQVLYQDITKPKRAEQQVRELVQGTIAAQEAERKRICLEVHDGVAQTMVSALHYIQALQDSLVHDTHPGQLLSRAGTLVRQAIKESREIISSLQPSTLKELGLIPTLRQEMKQLGWESGWKVDFKADSVRLPPDIEIGLYRIIHEAIANAKKHSGTSRLAVSLSCSNDQVVVKARDWGTGFDYSPDEISVKQGIGLFSMCRRAELLQGKCVIRSTAGQGTTVHLEIPIEKQVAYHGKD